MKKSFIRPYWMTFGVITIPFVACRHANLAISEYGIPMVILLGVGLFECLKQMFKDGSFRLNSKAIGFSILIVLVCIQVLFLGSNTNSGYALSYGIYFMVGLISMYLNINKREIAFLLTSYLISSSTIAILMFVHPYMYYGRYSYKFFSAPAFEPNYLAFFYMNAVIIGIIKMLYFENKKSNKRLVFLCIVLNGAAAIATGSRNSLLGFLIIFMYFAFNIKSKKARRTTVGIIFLGSIGFFILNMFYPMQIVDRVFNSKILDESNMSRLQHWIFALKAIKERPFLGYGIMTSIEAIGTIGVKTGAHNSFLGIWLNMGIGGVLLVFYNYFLIMKHSLKQRKNFLIFASIALIAMEMIVEFDIIYSFWFSMIILLKSCSGYEENILEEMGLA